VERPRGIGQNARECIEFSEQQRSGACHRREFGDAMCARLGTVGSRKGIHHEHVAQRRHPACQRLAVLLFALVEAHIFAKHHGTWGAFDAADGLAELPALLNRQMQVNEAGEYVARFLYNNGEAGELLAMLGKLLLREDRDFHTIQSIEAAFQQ